jgi:hypothetical protein
MHINVIALQSSKMPAHTKFPRRVRKIAESDCWLCHVCPSVRKERPWGLQWDEAPIF